MSALITVLHIVTCVVLITAILLQSGKAADLAGAFGGGGSQTAFGPRGTASLFSKITTACAVLFMLTSLSLWILSARGAKSVLSGEEPAKKDIPAATETKKESQEPDTRKAETKPAAEQTPTKSPEKEKKE